jgi:phosphocarrier protein HPr
MAERVVAVAGADGLHARPAALFVRAVAESGMAVRIGRADGESDVDARSILAVLGLDVRSGDRVRLSADGEGADGVLDRLVATLVGEDPDGGH